MKKECDNYKKILIINNESINNTNATSITLQSMFKSYPKDNILELFLSNKKTNKKQFLGKSYFGKGKTNLYSLLYNSKLFQSANKKSKDKSLVPAIEENKKNRKNIRTTIIAFFDSIPFLVPRKIKKKIDDFKPDVIYTLGASISSLKYSLKISKYLSIPVIIHFMDNWQETLYTNTVFKIGRNKIKRLLKKVYKQTNENLTISKKMAIEYSRKWQKPHYSIMNVPTVSSFFVEPLINVNNEIIFTYAGGLHLQRWQGLLHISKILKKQSNLTFKKIKLKIFTDSFSIEAYKKMFDDSICEFYPRVSHKEIEKIYLESHVLVHIESFQEEIVKFTKFSISTKIPEYMAIGRPILLFAPQKIAVYELVEDSKSGFACYNEAQLEKAIFTLITNNDIRKTMSLQGMNYFKSNFSQEVVIKTINYFFSKEGAKK